LSNKASEQIYSHRWSPPSGSSVNSRPCGVYLLHGTGEHCGRYDAFANALTQAGWAVGAHDHPGHGQSSGDRGLVSPNGLLAVQAAIKIQAFAEETGAPPIVFGHSLGGVVASELVLSHHLPVSGLIMSAPAFRPYLSTINRLKVNALFAFAPDKAVELKYRPDLLTHDKDIQNQAIQDSLIHGFRTARMIRYMLDSGAQSIAKSHTLNTPTLALVAAADPVVENSAIEDWIRGASEQWVTKKTYSEAFHELLKELPETRNQVTADVLQWLDNLKVSLNT